MKVVMDVFLCYVLCMLTALVPSCSSLDKKEFTFYLDETHASEGSWKNGPLLPETDRYNNNGATYFWREQNGRHPYVEFTTLGTEKITMDSFSVSIWTKIALNAPNGGVIWNVACKNCIERCPASIRLVATHQGAQVFIVPINKENKSYETLCGLRAQRPRIINTVTRIITNTWRHIVVVLDAKSGRFELYVDGKLDGFVEGAIKYNVLASRILSNFIVGCQFVDDGQKSPSGGLTSGGPYPMSNDNLPSGAMPASYDDLKIWNYPISKDYIKNLSEVDCKISEWTKWNSCKVYSTNSYAEKIRTRKVLLHPMNNGKACTTNLEERRKCDLKINL